MHRHGPAQPQRPHRLRHQPGLAGQLLHVGTTSIGSIYTHDFDNGWKFQQNLRYMHSVVDFLSSGPDVVLNPDGRTQDIGLQYRPKSSNTFLMDNNIQGSFNIGAIRHKLITGIDYSHYKAEETRLNGDPEDAFNNLDLTAQSTAVRRYGSTRCNVTPARKRSR